MCVCDCVHFLRLSPAIDFGHKFKCKLIMFAGGKYANNENTTRGQMQAAAGQRRAFFHVRCSATVNKF